MTWFEGFWHGVAHRLAAWLGTKAVGMAWLKGYRHGMAHRLSAWLVYCAVILLGVACCAVLWCGFCWCAVSSSGSAVLFPGWACRAMPFSDGVLYRSWQLCHGLAYSGLACAFVVACVGILCHTIAWRGLFWCAVPCSGLAVPFYGVSYNGIACCDLAVLWSGLGVLEYVKLLKAG